MLDTQVANGSYLSKNTFGDESYIPCIKVINFTEGKIKMALIKVRDDRQPEGTMGKYKVIKDCKFKTN